MNKYCNAKLLKKTLDNFIMGQEEGTRSIAMAIANHLQNIEAKERGHLEKGERIQTDNVLLIGPTGCGKTETFRVLRQLEQIFRCPVIFIDSSLYSGNGTWRNTKPIKTIFNDVVIRAGDIYFEENGYDNEDSDIIREEIIKIANNAIILIDEFDKLSLKGTENGLLYYQEYQNTLLRLIEGEAVKCHNMTTSYKKAGDDDDNDKKTIEIEDIELDTANMLFIMLGAFDGLKTITRYRLHQEWLVKHENDRPRHILYQDTTLGFTVVPQKQNETDLDKEPEYSYNQLIPSTEDLVRYGFMPELVGRIPLRTVYNPLSEEVLVDILLHCKTSVYRDYQRRFQRRGHLLRCNRSALWEIAHTAVGRGSGARGLRNVFSEKLQQVEYELSGDERAMHVLLRGKDIRDGKSPLIHDCTKKAINKQRKRVVSELKKVITIAKAKKQAKKGSNGK